MAQSLIFHSLSAIHEHCSGLYRQARAIECKKERKRRLRRLANEALVRLDRIIVSAAYGNYAGLPRHLSQDELGLKHALDNFPDARLQLRQFYRRVLQPAREDEQRERHSRRFENTSDYEHPDPYPYLDDADPDEVRQELSFRESDEYLEMGKTYFWYIHRYDERPAFAAATTHGNCESCGEGLPVWRSCTRCAFDHFIHQSDEIYVTSLECNRPQHQIDLRDVTKCQNCGGPPNIVIERAEVDNEMWTDQEWI